MDERAAVVWEEIGMFLHDTAVCICQAPTPVSLCIKLSNGATCRKRRSTMSFPAAQDARSPLVD
jgi:hypothetical protein